MRVLISHNMATGVLASSDKEAISIYKDIIQQELSKDVIDYGTQPGLRAIHVVARAGDVELMKSLLRKRANVNFCTAKGLSPLHYAVLSNKPQMVQLLLLYGACINHQSLRDGRTPLFISTKKGFFEITKILLENGASPHLLDDDGYCPREIAEENCYHRIAALLAEYEKRVQMPSRSSSTQIFPTAPPVIDEADSSPYDEPPPSYEEVINASSMFAASASAYSLSEDCEDDTTALLPNTS